MLHKVKDKKDVIVNGHIYHCGSDGIVDLPVLVDNADVKPIKAEPKEEIKSTPKKSR